MRLVSPVPRLPVTFDEPTSELIRRLAPAGGGSKFAHAAVWEKAARDEQRGELDELRREHAELRVRLARVERELGLEP